jgi:hypothetical protein
MALHDNELDYESSLKRLEEALAATESTAAEYRKQIETEALERAIKAIKGAVYVTDDPSLDIEYNPMFLSTRQRCLNAVQKLKDKQ